MISAKNYIENCKRHGKQTEREHDREALYKKAGCQIYLADDNGLMEELRSTPQAKHDDEQDAMALEGAIQQAANRKVEQQEQLMREGFNPVSPKSPKTKEREGCRYCQGTLAERVFIATTTNTQLFLTITKTSSLLVYPILTGTLL